MSFLRHFICQFLRHYLLAVQFFTRIPITGRLAAWVGYSPAMLRASAAHFPGVGWLVGALALVLALLAKVALLALVGSVSEDAMCLGLFAAHVVPRALALVLVRAMPHVGNDANSKSKPLADQISWGSLLAAFGWSFMAVAIVQYTDYGTNLIVPVLAGAMAMAWMWRLFWRRLQGFAGDCLGATQQVCELAFYLGLALAL